MKTWRTWCVIAAALAAAGCGGPTKTAAPPGPPAPVAAIVAPAAEPAASPPDLAVPVPEVVLADLTIADVTALIPLVATFADQVQPGAGATFTFDRLRASLSAAGFELAAIDLTRPVHFLFLDPKQYPAAWVAVVAIGDRAAFDAIVGRVGALVREHDGYAAFGRPDALEAVSAYALTTLVAAPVPPQPTLRFEMAKYAGLSDQMLDEARGKVMHQLPPVWRAPVMQFLDAYIALFVQTEEMSMVVDLTAARLSTTVRMLPRPGTAFAAFVAAQRPGRFDLFGELPAGEIVTGGALDAGALWEVMTVLAATAAQDGYGDGDGVERFLTGWPALMDGENAWVMDLAPDGFAATALWETGAPAGVAALWRDFAQGLARIPLSGRFDLKLKLDATRHRGVALSTFAIRATAKATDDEREALELIGGKVSLSYGVHGARFLLTAGSDAIQIAKAAIDRATLATRAVDPVLAAVVAELRQRRESYVVAVDLVAARAVADAPAPKRAKRTRAKPVAPPVAPQPPAVMALGVDGGALTLRFTLPAAQVVPLL